MMQPAGHMLAEVTRVRLWAEPAAAGHRGRDGLAHGQARKNSDPAFGRSYLKVVQAGNTPACAQVAAE